MSAQQMGLQIFDASGNIILDASTMTTEVIGFGETNGAAGSLTNAAINNKAVWTKIYDMNSGIFYPKFAVSGNTISWTFEVTGEWETTAEPTNVKFIYGVYG